MVPSGADRLDSWKEIAAHLNRSVRTVRRWEAQEGLPVHRLQHEKRGSVYAYKPELDAWRQSRELIDEPPAGVPEQESPRRLTENLAGSVHDATARPARTLSGSISATARTNGAISDAISAAIRPNKSISGATAAAVRPAHTRLVAGIFVGLAGFLAAMYGRRQILKHEGATLTVTPLTSYPGNERQPSLSPDGNQVAFAFNDGGSSNYHIYVKVIGSEEVVRLTSDSADDLSPSWSPDGQSIGFLRFVSDKSARVIVMPSSGGAERQLAKILISGTERDIRVTWSPDGGWIATSNAETPLSPMRLVLISARTGEERRLVYQPPTVEADVSPAFSPDGRYLAFARHISPVVADIYVLELPKEGRSNAEARRLTNWNRMNSSPVWTGDGRDILFVGDAPRLGPRIWRIATFDPADPLPMNQIGEDSSSITLCPRKNRLIYAKESEDANIWRIDFDLASSVPARRRSASFCRLIASTRSDANAQYSPDGKHIAFQSERSGYSEIWMANSDGSGSRQLTHLNAKVSGYPRWSPDCKHIAFHSRPSGYANVYVIDVETGAYRQLTIGTTNDSAPSWSHDGKWIYFGSERQDRSQIWRVPAGGGPATQLTKTGGAVALESVDGKLLFYSKFAEPGLWVVPLAGGAESQILPSLYGIDTFAVTKRGIYFVRRTAELQASVCFRSFFLPVTQDLARVTSPMGMGLAVSPDENSILYTQVDQTGSDLILVDNLK